MSNRHSGHADNLIEMLTTQVGVKQQEIDALLDITRAINDNVPEDSLLQIFDLTLLVHLGVKRIVVFLHDDIWNLARQRGADEVANKINVERDLMHYKEVVQFEPDGERPEGLEVFDLIIPVYHKEQALAYVLMAYPRRESYEVMDEKIRFIQAFTNIVVVAVENKKLFKKQLEQEGMKRELEVAAHVQNMLIPSELPDNDKVQVAAVYLPHQNVGGDYYDFIELSDEEFVFVMADISGKGTSAALLMANFQANVRALIKTASVNLKAFVRQLNANVLEITKGERFITMFLGRYNTTSRKLTYISCGHNPSILYHDGEAQLLSEGCPILGIIDDLPFINIGQVDVPPGAVIVNYTDGVTDLQNPQGLYYSTDHMVHHLQKHPDVDMKTYIRGIMSEIYRFKGAMEYVDDITILTMRVH